MLPPRLPLSLSLSAEFGSFSTYPYSLKLFWSPIVDSVYSRSFGRRKSWIVPIQAIIGSFMLWIGRDAEALLASAEHDITRLTAIFVLMIFFAATQGTARSKVPKSLSANHFCLYAYPDIAVDGASTARNV